jgi:regulator of sigma E protease
MIILSLIAFLVIFSALILVHEYGHFTAAKKSGVKVEEFSLGMGKLLWKKQKGETQYSLRAVPFGGYVKMLGEEDKSDDPRSFSKAKLWRRMMITLAGVFMNFVMAILALTVLFTAGTNPILITDADVERAEAAGLLVLSEEVNEDGKRELLEIVPIQKPFPQSLLFATTETYRISVAVVQKLGEIPVEIIKERRIPEGLAGPVGIAEITHKIVPLGLLALLKLFALLSISLGVINLLPIPALDGGRFLFQIVELVTFRKPPESWENAIHMAGFILLMGLLVVITWNDIMRVFF